MFDLKALIAETTEKFNALEASKYGKQAVVERDGVTCTMSLSPRSYRRSARVTMQFKRDGKVVSRATLEGAIRGEINEALRSEFEAQAPEIKADFVAQVRRQYAYLVEKCGPALAVEYKSGFYRAAQTMRAFCDVVSEQDPTVLYPKTIVVARPLNETRLDERAEKYAQAAAVEWFHKTNAKLGAIESPELVRDVGGYVIVQGTRNGRAILMRQQRVLKWTQHGEPFNQFPALIYVDGQFTPEAEYKKLFDDK